VSSDKKNISIEETVPSFEVQVTEQTIILNRHGTGSRLLTDFGDRFEMTFSQYENLKNIVEFLNPKH
jgi:creatinine amidohydrolase/Fe(II)-dependent formamide hydrolase-like protein